MNVTIRVVGKAQTIANLRKYAELTGNGVETGIKEIGITTAKALASKVQPFGLTKVDKFSKSIQSQVKRAIRNANVQGASGSIESAHKSRRNQKGQVSKDLNTKGQYKAKPFDPQDRKKLGDKKALNAGLAKGAWVEAGNSLVRGFSKARGALKRINVRQEINRHIGKGNGISRDTKSGISFTIYLTNKLNYIQKTMTSGNIAAALKMGQQNGHKRLIKHIIRETKKLNKL